MLLFVSSKSILVLLISTANASLIAELSTGNAFSTTRISGATGAGAGGNSFATVVIFLMRPSRNSTIFGTRLSRRPSQQWPATVEAFKTKYAEAIKGLGLTATTGLKLMDMMNIAISLPEQQQEIRKDIYAVISNVFPGMNVNDIVDYTVAGNINAAKAYYAGVNFDFYMSQKDDDGVLYIDLAPGKNAQSWMVYYRNAAELAQSGLRLHASTVYPVSKDPRMAYPQMSVVATKQQPQDNIA
jgi:hypothetical protein